MKIINWIKSLFTDKPISINKNDYWFYRRGKRISQMDLVTEYANQMIKDIKNRVENGPNIHVK